MKHCIDLDKNKYGIQENIAVLESKEQLLAFHQFEDDNFIQLFKLDTRLLTTICESLNEEYDAFIIVYDFQEFSKDPDFMEAVIWHELGHLSYPVQGGIDTESEILCDQLALSKGCRTGLEKVLTGSLYLAALFQNFPLLDSVRLRREALHRYTDSVSLTPSADSHSTPPLSDKTEIDSILTQLFQEQQNNCTPAELVDVLLSEVKDFMAHSASNEAFAYSKLIELFKTYVSESERTEIIGFLILQLEQTCRRND